MAGKNNNNNIKFSLRTILAAVGLAIGAATVVATIMSSVYCSKAELAMIKEEMTKDMTKVEFKVAKAEWQDEVMVTRIKNIERRQIQMSENITKLLMRLRVQPVDPPYLAPMPMRPAVVIPE